MAFRFLHGGVRHLCEQVPPRLVGPCPGCGSLDSVVARTGETTAAPLVGRKGTVRTSPAALSCCGLVGHLELSPDTIFGEDEDDAVLRHGRARVYWGDGTVTDGGRP